MMKVPTPLKAAVSRTLLAWIQNWAAMLTPSGKPLPPREPRDTRKESPDDATDGMDPENVERVVVAEKALQARCREEAASARDGAQSAAHPRDRPCPMPA